MVADGELYNSLTQLMNESPKPNRSSVENRNFQLTLSNAFSASNVTMTVLIFELLEWCMILNSLRVLFEDSLPFTKPV
jgi:hypothetical protein